MTAPTPANFYKITFMGRACTYGRTEDCSMENGITTKCMEKGYLPGPTVGNMKALTKMTKSMDSEYSPSETDESTKGSGRMGSSTDVEYTERRKFLGRACGKTG